MTIDTPEHAEAVAAALAASRPITPPFLGQSPQPLAQAYAIAAEVRARQDARRVGLKVGFTNRAIWPVYGVDRPIWGVVQAETLCAPGPPVSLSRFSLPRLEPEIVLGLARAPEPGMTLAQCAECVDWVAPGFEIVQSIYADWKFSVADAIAAQALHGCLCVGARIKATPDALAALSDVPVELLKDGRRVETGTGANALDGPVHVLQHLVSLLPEEDALCAGELVTTGTLTDAWPIAAGDVWTARFGGVMKADLRLEFA